MEIKISKLILNEYSVVEEMVRTSTIPQYYNNIDILINRLFRYFYELDKDNAVDLLKQELDKLDIVYEDKAVDDTIKKYTVIQPLKRTNGINIYQEEVDAINKISGRQNQRVAFCLLMVQKILSPHSNKMYFTYEKILPIMNSITSKKELDATIYPLQQSGIIDIPLFDDYIEIKIARTDGKVHTVIKDNFDKIDGWFDEIFEDVKPETIVMVNLSNDETRIFKHMGYRGTANVLQNEGIKITGARIKECCDLTKEQLNGNTYFVLDEKWCEAGDYELRKTNYIETMITIRHILIENKRNKNKKKKLYVRIDGGGDEILTVRIK